MTNTERKLGEAKYFLRQLTPDYVYFDYILSAYLNAARSVTWIMRHEFDKVVGWECWFKSCEISEKEKKLLKEINDFRILSAKKTGIKTDYYFMDGLVVEKEEDYQMVESFISEYAEGEVIKITLYDENDEQFHRDSNGEDDFSIILRRKDDDENNQLSRKSISNLCNDYFIFIEKQVNICVGKYSQ